MRKIIALLFVVLICCAFSSWGGGWQSAPRLQVQETEAAPTLVTQDFTADGWIEYDANSCISRAADAVTVTDGEVDFNGYVYKDYTSITDFHHRIQANCSELASGSQFGFYSCGAGYGTIADMIGTYEYVNCRFADFGAGDLMLLQVNDAAGESIYSAQTSFSLNTNYYFDFLREGGVLTVTMDNDADMSSPLTQFTVSTSTTYRYIQAVHSRESGSSTADTTMVISNLQVEQ